MADVKPGDVVVVGPRYVMADHPPYAGNGRFEADEWTGQILRVRTLSADGMSANLMPAAFDLSDADVSDEIVTITVRRLSPKA